jgi:hypothetical protein
VLVNCIVPDVAVRAVRSIVRFARELDALPGAYANLGSAEPLAAGGFDIAMTPEQFAEATKPLLDGGARIVGGCCGTTPEHIRALRTLLDERLATEAAEREAADPEWRALVTEAASRSGGGRALVVGGEAPSDWLAAGPYDVVRLGGQEVSAVPEASFQLAIVDGGGASLDEITRVLQPGGWFVARIRGDGAERSIALEGLEIRELRQDGRDALILARRST